MRFRSLSGLTSLQVRAYCRRIRAAHAFGTFDIELVQAEILADVLAGIDPEIAQRRHWLRSIRFYRATRRPSDRVKIALRAASVTTNPNQNIAGTP